MKWYTKYLQVYEKPFSEAPQEIVEEVRNKLKLLQSDNPLVTVSLIGYNEEKHLLASLWSLSEMKCKYPIEIIGTDNDSKDQTATIYEATGIPYVIEHQHSCALCGAAVHVSGDKPSGAAGISCRPAPLPPAPRPVYGQTSTGVLVTRLMNISL